MYLDCDTTPALRSRYLRCRTVDAAVRQASRLIGDAEGQIGIYTGNPVLAEGFAGYVIRYAGEPAYFEPAQ